MSYSFSTQAITNDGDPAVYDFLAEAFEKSAAENQRSNGTYDEAKDHLSVAADAAHALLGGLGFSGVDSFTVSVSGHANPGHTKREGWANEFCQVNVAVQSYRTADDPTIAPH